MIVIILKIIKDILYILAYLTLLVAIYRFTQQDFALFIFDVLLMSPSLYLAGTIKMMTKI